MFHYVTLKKHTQSNSKQSQTQLSSAQGNPTPKKQVGQLREGLKRNPIKENPASNSTTKKHCIDFLSKQPSREWIWKNNKNVSEKQTKPTWAKEYMRQVLSDLGADHEWITSTSSISSFCSDIFFLMMMMVFLCGLFVCCRQLWTPWVK